MHALLNRVLRGTNQAGRRRARRGLQLESFEDRRLLATFDLTPTPDGAAGSLRAALNAVNTNGEHDLVNLAAGVYSVSISGTGDDDNLRGDFDILESGRSVVIRGAGIGVTTIDGGQLDRVFDVFATATVHLENLTVRGGKLTGPNDDSDGGGIRNTGNLHLDNVEIVDNEGHAGGGIMNDGVATITDSLIHDNQSSVFGGGIKTYGPLSITDSRISNNTGGQRGGGIEIDGASGVNIVNSTISGNSVGGGTGGGINNYGGTLQMRSSTIAGNVAGLAGGLAEEGGASTLTNVTISGNSAVLNGGAIYNNGGETTLYNSTISGNTADNGGGVYNYGGVTRPKNTIFADNTADTAGPDFFGSMKGFGFNLIGDSSATRFHRDDQGHNILDVEAMLGPLQDNGGNTLTHALLNGSPAIDAGTALSAPDTDQRGATRPQGSAVDLGSFELEAASDIEPPTVELVEVSPDPRTVPAAVISILFSEDVIGFDVADFTLTRDGQQVDLVGRGATVSQTLPGQYLLDLAAAGLADVDGQYVLTLNSSDITDLAGNPLVAGDSDSWFYDGTPPTADIVDIAPDPRSTPVGAVTINFTENVSGVDLSDFRLLRNGSSVNLAALGATLTSTAPGVYRLDLSPAGITDQDGNYELILNASGSGIQDSAGNALAGDASDTWAFDFQPPTADILNVSPDPRDTSVPAVIIAFSENVVGVSLDDFSLTRNGQSINLASLGASLGELNPKRYVITLSPPGLTDVEGAYELTLHAAGSGIQDLFGNPLTADASDSWIFDGGSPTADIVDVTPDPRTAPVSTVLVNFSEAVTGVDLGDFRLTRNGAAVNLSGNGVTFNMISASQYELNLSSVTGSDGSYVLTLTAAGSGIQDIAGRALSGDAFDAWSLNGSPPTVDIVDIWPDPRNTPVGLVAISFSEDVTGVDLSDLTLTRNGVAVDLVAGGALLIQTLPNHYLLDLFNLAEQDGEYLLSLNSSGSGIRDNAGSALANSASDSWSMDGTPPTVQIVQVAPDPRNTYVDSLTIQVSEPVTGLNLDRFTLTVDGLGVDLSAAGATLSQVNSTQYRLDLSQVDAGDGSYAVTLNGNGVRDLIGNPLTASASESWFVDSTAPTARIQDVAPDPRTTPVASLTVTFSEQVFGVDLADFALSRDGQVLDLGAMGATLTPSTGFQYVLHLSGAADSDGAYQLTLNAGGSGIQDSLGNALAAGDSDSWFFDGTAPEVTIAEVSPDPRNVPVSVISIDFSEAVTGFSLYDLTFRRDGQVILLASSGGVLRAISADHYELDLSAAGLSDVDGQYSLTLNAAASGITDLVGNSLDADAGDSWTLDATPPTAAMQDVSPDPRHTAVATLRISFSEEVSGVDLADFLLTVDGSPIDLVAAGATLNPLSNIRYELNLAAGGLGAADGQYELTLIASASGIVDAAGNALLEDAGDAWLLDGTPPVAVIEQVTPDPRNTPVTTLPIAFSESVVGVDLADFLLTIDGSPIDLAAAGVALNSLGNDQYELDLAAGGLGAADGRYELTLNASASGIIDEAGNALLQNAGVSWLLDATPPTAVVEEISPNPRSEPVETLLISFSESVTGLDLADFLLRVDGSPVELAAAALNPLGADQYELNLAVGGLGAAEGQYELTLVASASGIVDGAGNALLQDADASWLLDATPPEASIAEVSPNPRNLPLATIAISFSEEVVGFDLSDLTLTRDNGQVDLVGLGATLTEVAANEYLLDLSAAGINDVDGSYVLTLQAAPSGIVDRSGQGLPADVSQSWIVDATPPSAVIEEVTPDPRSQPVATLLISFSENVTGLTLADFSLTRDGVALDLNAAGAVLSELTPHQFELDLSAGGLGAAGGQYVLTLSAATSSVVDVVGNSLQSDASESWTIVLTPPVVEIEAVTPDPRSQPVSTISFTFSQAVTGFDLQDLSLTVNDSPLDLAALGALLTAVSASEYELALGNAQANDGGYRLTLNASQSGITSLAGLGLLADAGEAWVLDATAPTAMVEEIAPDPRETPVATVTVTFSENVTGVDLADFSLSRDGQLIDLSAAGVTLQPLSADQYQLDFSASADTDDAGVYVLTLNAAGSQITDMVGNPLAANTSDSWTTMEGPLTVTISEVVPDPRVTPPSSVTYQFSEAVINFDLGDLRLTFNGNEINLFVGGAVLTQASDTEFVLDLSALNLTRLDGEYVLTLVAENSGIQDTGGELLRQGLVEGWAFDDEPPRVTIRPVAPDPRNSPVGGIVINSTDGLNGLEVGDFSLTLNDEPLDLQAIGATIVLSGNNEYFLQFPPGTISADGDYVLFLDAASSGVTDYAGNELQDDLLETWRLDSVTPTVDIVDVFPDPRSTAPDAVTILFSEPVTGVDLTDFQLTRDGGFVSLLAGAVLTEVSPGEFQLDLSSPGLADVNGHYVLTLNPFNSGIQDLAENELDFSPVSDAWDIDTDLSAFTVVSVGINVQEIDPPDLPKGPQRTSWTQQRSEIGSITITFSEDVSLRASDLGLTNLGVKADQDPDTPFLLTDAHLSVRGNVAILTFATGELSDGVYQLEVLPSATSARGGVLDGNGDGAPGDSFIMKGNEENRFYRLQAEWNGDTGVSVFDFPVFSYWFGLPVGEAPAYVDLNNDGGLSIFDFPAFKDHFGAFVTFPTNLTATPQIAHAQEENLAEGEPREQGAVEERALAESSRLWQPLEARPRNNIEEASFHAQDSEFEDTLEDIVEEISKAWAGRS